MGVCNTCLPCDKGRSLLHLESTLSLTHCFRVRQPHATKRTVKQTHSRVRLMWGWITQIKSAQGKDNLCFITNQSNLGHRYSVPLPGNDRNILICLLISEHTHTSGSIDIMIIIFTLFLQFALCASGCGWCIVDDGCVSCRPSEVLMMSPLPQPGYGTGAVSRPG